MDVSNGGSVEWQWRKCRVAMKEVSSGAEQTGMGIEIEKERCEWKLPKISIYFHALGVHVPGSPLLKILFR